MTLPSTYKQMFSTVSEDGKLTMALHDKPMPTPEADEIIVRIEATPINPSDHGVMFGGASMDQAVSSGDGADKVFIAPVSPQAMAAMKGRVGQDLPVGNEGAGTVVAAGESEYAQSLMGRVVAVMGGASMYAQYRCVPAAQAMPLLPDCTAKDGASSFVNPLTVLCFIETMRSEEHTAMVHTAAASNLGQMLNKACQADGIDIANVVRSQEQVDILKGLGAKYIVNSSSDTFMADLTDALEETGATIAFDATGGGGLASNILIAMEAAAARTPTAFSVYGSTNHKQVYLYGGLDTSPTEFAPRSYGMAWSIGGWLMPNFLAKFGTEVGSQLRTRVAKELKTTFASHYTDEISLSDALDSEIVASYNAKSTGSKFLICPQLEM